MSSEPQTPALYDVWTSTEARAQVLADYELRLRGLGAEVASRELDTRFGRTHVLLAGPVDAPPLIVLHGGNGDAVQMAVAYLDFAARHRCVFVDLPGEPNRSEGPRIPRAGDSLARWMAEVLDGLELGAVAMMGMSAGAYVALRCALGLGPRVTRVAALVPEGFCALAPIPTLEPGSAAAFIEQITAPDSGFPPIVLERMADSMARVFAALRSPMELGPLFTAEEFARFETPVLVVAGARDRLFPVAQLSAAVRAVLPSLVELIVIPEANHLHLRLFRGPELERVAAFLA